VPPFGDWDDGNAASGEKYTGIFNKVRDNKLSPSSSIGQPSTAYSQENNVQQVCKSLLEVLVSLLYDFPLQASNGLVSSISIKSLYLSYYELTK
jgi:hypothetical protein